MRSMQNQYGSEEGKKVFYASINKGTIEGVEEEVRGTASAAMKDLMKRTADLKAKKERAALMAANRNRKDENTMKNAYVRRLMETGPKDAIEADFGDSPQGREQYKKLSSRPKDLSPVQASRANRRRRQMTNHPNADKALKSLQQNVADKPEADEQNRAFRRGTMKDHTEYHTIGALMAEALGLAEGKTTGDDAEATGERVGRAIMKSGADPERVQRIARRVANRKGPDHTTERGREFGGGLAKAGKVRKRRMSDAINLKAHTEYQKIGALMAEAMGLVEMQYRGKSYISKRVNKENKPRLRIPAGSTLSPRVPVVEPREGETTAQAIRREAEEKGKAGKNPRG